MTLDKCIVLRIRTLTGCPLCRESHTLCRQKNPTVISIWLLVGFHPATRSVQSTTADNTRKRVWQYIEKERERKKERKKDKSVLHTPGSIVAQWLAQFALVLEVSGLIHTDSEDNFVSKQAFLSVIFAGMTLDKCTVLWIVI